MFKRFTLLIISLSLITATLFTGCSSRKKFETIVLEEEPDGIFCSAHSSSLYIVNDSTVTLCNQNNILEDIPTDYEISALFPDGKSVWMIDTNNDLYKLYNDCLGGELVLSDIADFSSNGLNYGAVTTNGELYVWGENLYGTLGTGSSEKIEKPALLEGITNVSRISFGYSYSLLLTDSGEMFECGRINR